jgi:hypothetical protein
MVKNSELFKSFYLHFTYVAHEITKELLKNSQFENMIAVVVVVVVVFEPFISAFFVINKTFFTRA